MYTDYMYINMNSNFLCTTVILITYYTYLHSLILALFLSTNVKFYLTENIFYCLNKYQYLT